MTEKKKIHTGTYILGNQEENSSFGGVFGILKVPKYTHEIGFFINNNLQNKQEKFDDAVFYSLSIKELEAMHKAFGQVINDLKKLESLSRKNLLKDNAYHTE